MVKIPPIWSVKSAASPPEGCELQLSGSSPEPTAQSQLGLSYGNLEIQQNPMLYHQCPHPHGQKLKAKTQCFVQLKTQGNSSPLPTNFTRLLVTNAPQLEAPSPGS